MEIQFTENDSKDFKLEFALTPGAYHSFVQQVLPLIFSTRLYVCRSFLKTVEASHV